MLFPFLRGIITEADYVLMLYSILLHGRVLNSFPMSIDTASTTLNQIRLNDNGESIPFFRYEY